MEKNYEHIISQAIEHIMEVMKPRVSPEELHQESMPFKSQRKDIASNKERVENLISSTSCRGTHRCRGYATWHQCRYCRPTA